MDLCVCGKMICMHLPFNRGICPRLIEEKGESDKEINVILKGWIFLIGRLGVIRKIKTLFTSMFDQISFAFLYRFIYSKNPIFLPKTLNLKPLKQRLPLQSRKFQRSICVDGIWTLASVQSTQTICERTHLKATDFNV